MYGTAARASFVRTLTGGLQCANTHEITQPVPPALKATQTQTTAFSYAAL